MLAHRMLIARRLGDESVADQTEQALEEYLAGEDFVDFPEQLTYAEALVRGPSTSEAHCTRAAELLDDFFERTGADETELPEEYQKTIRAIRDGISSRRSGIEGR